MSATETITFIPVNEIFPDIISNLSTLKSLLEELSLLDTLFWCSRINIFLSHFQTDIFEAQNICIDMFLNNEEKERIKKYKDRLNGEKSALFFRGQLLEFIRWVLLYSHIHADDGNTFEREDIKRKFVKALLITSDVWSNRVFGNKLTLKEDINLSRQYALAPFRKSIEETTSAPNFLRAFGRGKILFQDYLPIYYTEFENEFESSTNLTVEQYFSCLLSICAEFMKPDLNGNLFNKNEIGNSTNYKMILPKFMLLMSQTPDELKKVLWGNGCKQIFQDENIPSYDYLPIREKPIIYTKDGRAIIMDPIFYLEKASIAPLFYIVKQNPEKANEIFGCFGKAFERYSLDILKRIYPDASPLLARRLNCNYQLTDENSKKVEVDAYINDVNELVVFEMKAIFIRESEKNDVEKYLDELREKYGLSLDDENNIKIKGVGQLARIVNIITSNAWIDKNSEFKNTKTIFPLLVVHDPFLTAPLHGTFLASEFKSFMSPDKELKTGELIKGPFMILPPIIISIDDLEDIETSLENFRLCDLLFDYSMYCPERQSSLYNYICLSKYKAKMRQNRYLLDITKKIVEKTLSEVFSIKTPENSNKQIRRETTIQ